MKVARGGLTVLALGLVLSWPGAGQASRSLLPEVNFLREHYAEIGAGPLVRLLRELPRRREAEKPEAFAERLQDALDAFKHKVADRYTETTLLRLLDYPRAETRRAAVMAVGLTGTMNANAAVAGMLHDEEYRVRRVAADALWQLWFHADTPANNRELERLMLLAGSNDPDDRSLALEGLSALSRNAPRFAEAYNQRAVLYFRQGEYRKAIGDCVTVLKLNPYHFGAASGMGQAYMKLKDPRGALGAFRTAYRLNPNLEDVGRLVRLLEKLLGEKGK